MRERLGKAFVGPQAVLEGVIARILQDYDGFRIDVQRIVALADTVLVEARPLRHRAITYGLCRCAARYSRVQRCGEGVHDQRV
jgi:hypothetical protein